MVFDKILPYNDDLSNSFLWASYLSGSLKRINSFRAHLPQSRRTFDSFRRACNQCIMDWRGRIANKICFSQFYRWGLFGWTWIILLASHMHSSVGSLRNCLGNLIRRSWRWANKLQRCSWFMGIYKTRTCCTFLQGWMDFLNWMWDISWSTLSFFQWNFRSKENWVDGDRP